MESLIYIELDFKKKTYLFYVLVNSDLYHLIYKIVAILSVPLQQLTLLYHNSINLLDEKTCQMLQYKKTKVLSEYFSGSLKVKLKAELSLECKPAKILQIKLNDHILCFCKKSNAEFIVRSSQSLCCRLCFKSFSQLEPEKYISINQNSNEKTIKNYLNCIRLDADLLMKKFESAKKSNNFNDNCRIELLFRELNYKLNNTALHFKELVYFFSDELIYCCNELFGIEKLFIQVSKIVNKYVLVSTLQPNIKEFEREINERLKDLADMASTIVKPRRPAQNTEIYQTIKSESENNITDTGLQSKINIYNNFNISIHTGNNEEVIEESTIQNQLITHNLINGSEINQINNINLSINTSKDPRKNSKAALKIKEKNEKSETKKKHLRFNEVFNSSNLNVASHTYETMSSPNLVASKYSSIQSNSLLSVKIPTVLSVLQSPTIERSNFHRVVSNSIRPHQRGQSITLNTAGRDVILSNNSVLENIKNFYSVRKKELAKYNKSVFEKLVFKN